ncbi:ATPase AAA [Acrocarpospora corrugata]|uniref:ATPase AAA n=1 Tax=Acrocarpospora corrugata TaxID=35763 RepID=A0A5M3W7D0_9ACTN|nr:AfsR/SARP family transcriptional regulator [Acrocarpospora corrugata]GES04957.1 ATPase AAA [Acrocarpospora corrugata]
MDFRLFGPFTVIGDDGAPVDLGPRQQRAVLAMLATEPGRIMSLDRIIDELWTGEPPSGATGTLQSYISHLRRSLEPGRAPRTPARVLLTREPGYLLAIAPGQVDLGRFAAWAEDGRRALARGAHAEALEALDQALALWRGRPLPEFAGYAFAEQTVGHLTEVHGSATEDRFDARLALGDSASCVADLERVIAVYPYRERLWSLLVLALYRSGRQADALGALRRVRRLLADELGLEPGPELRRIEQAVFDQSADLPGPPVPAAAPVVPGPPVPAGRLIARAPQLARVAARLGEVRRGRGGVLLFTGEAGIGKTRLAQAAAEEAEAQGVIAVWARCLESEGAPAFWPWLQVMRALGRTEAGSLLAGERADPGVDPGAALFALHERVLDAIGAGDPILIVLDDLHWADAASLRLLSFAAGELGRRPVLVLATLRPEPGRDPEQLRDTLAALTREPGTERLALPPFTPGEVHAFLGQRDVAGQELAEALYRRTGGNPFYLGELLRLLDSEHRLGAAAAWVAAAVPEGVREVIERRVARLPEQTRELLSTAAVLGRDVSLDVLAAATAVPAEEVMSALEPAIATGLLVEPPDGHDYRFSHALVRDALYAGLGRLRAARLHLKAGEALESLPGEDATLRLPLLAHHFGMAARVGGAARAVEYATAAARQAGAQRAYDEAVELWRRALAVLGGHDPGRRCDLLVELGLAHRDVGSIDGALAAVEEAIELASSNGLRDRLVAAVTVFGGLSVWFVRAHGVVDGRLVTILEELLAGPLKDEERAALLGTLGVELVFGPRREEGERLAAEGVELARRIGDPALLVRLLNNYVLTAWVPWRHRERAAAGDEMLSTPGIRPAAEIVGLVMRMDERLKNGELAEWAAHQARAEALAREVRRPELTAMLRVAQAAHASMHGRWDAAERLAAEATALLSATTIWGYAAPEMITVYSCRRAQGRVGEILDRLVSWAGEPDMYLLRAIAVLGALDVGDEALARELIARWGTEIRDDWSVEFNMVVWGYVAARLGTPDRAELYRRIAPFGDRLISIGTGMTCWGSTHQVLAALAEAMGDRVRALDHAERAHACHERLGLTYWSARSAELLSGWSGSPG